MGENCFLRLLFTRNLIDEQNVNTITDENFTTVYNLSLRVNQSTWYYVYSFFSKRFRFYFRLFQTRLDLVQSVFDSEFPLTFFHGFAGAG